MSAKKKWLKLFFHPFHSCNKAKLFQGKSFDLCFDTMQQPIWFQRIHFWSYHVITQTEDSPLSPKVLNRAFPDRAPEADANILSTSCEKMQTTATRDMWSADRTQKTVETISSDHVGIPAVLTLSFATYLHGSKQKAAEFRCKLNV